jgi:hypothetical protein
MEQAAPGAAHYPVCNKNELALDAPKRLKFNFKRPVRKTLDNLN